MATANLRVDDALRHLCDGLKKRWPDNLWPRLGSCHSVVEFTDPRDDPNYRSIRAGFASHNKSGWEAPQIDVGVGQAKGMSDETIVEAIWSDLIAGSRRADAEAA